MTFGATADVERYDEAVTWFFDRDVVTPEQLTGMVSGAANDAFWVGGGLQLDQIQRVFDKIGFAIEDGLSFQEWREQVLEELVDDFHAETVFRNATQRAYNAGRWHQMNQPDVLRFRPFFMFDAILDDRTTTICELCDGTLLPAEDEFWKTHIPPLHHRCRSSLRNLRRREAERLEQERPDQVKTVAPDTDDVRPPGDWGAVPEMGDGWRPDDDRYDPDLNAELNDKADNVVPIRTKRPTKKDPPKKKPNPPEAPANLPEKLSPAEAKRLLNSISRDGGKTFRSWTRSQLGRYGMSTDAPNTGLRVFPAKVMKGAEAFTIVNPKAGGWHGVIGLQKKHQTGLQKDLELATKGEQGRAFSLSTVVHEEIHLHAKANPDAYQYSRPSAFIEEVGTELLAERFISDIGAAKPLVVTMGETTATFSRQIAYQRAIEAALRDVMEVTGYTTAQAVDLIVEASKASRMPGNAGPADTHLEAFIRNVPLEAEKKDRLRELLESRKL